MSNRIRTALVAAGAFPALACALLFAPPALAAYPGGNGKIAYERDDGIDPEIYVMNADGSGQTNLTNDPPPRAKPPTATRPGRRTGRRSPLRGRPRAT